MNPVNLQAEWLSAARRVETRHIDWLEAQGVDRRSLYLGTPYGLPCGAAMFGVADIEPMSDGLYQPLVGGQRAIVMRTGIVGQHYDTEPTDLVAFLPDNPAKWWRRLGYDALIDERAAFDASWGEEPITVHSTPLDWLRAGCTGCVVLDPSQLHATFLTATPEIIADMPVNEARQLQKCLQQPPHRVPKVSMPESRIAA